MKTKLFAIVTLFFFLLTFAAFAQTNSVPNAAATVAVAANAINPFLALIAVAVPAIVALLKTKVFPNIPSVYLPLIAVALGFLTTWLANLSTLTNINPIYGTLLGAAGIGLREIKDQILPAGPAPLPEPQKPSIPVQ